MTMGKWLFVACCGVILVAASLGCDGQADLVPQATHGGTDYCWVSDPGDPTGRNLLITVKNQGGTAAPASTITIDFSNAGSVDVPTPPIPAGGSVALPKVSVPQSCFHPDCGFSITVDSKGAVTESNEANNKAGSGCVG